MFDGHGGKDAAQYVRDNLPRVIVEDAAFPLELEKAVRRSFMQTDSQFAEKCSLQDGLSSGTTALTAMIFGRYYSRDLQSGLLLNYYHFICEQKIVMQQSTGVDTRLLYPWHAKSES